MSVVPCDLHGETVSGKLLGFYLTVVQDGLRLTRRLKVCDSCVSNLQSSYGSKWSDGFILNRFTAESACAQCGELRGERGTLHPMYCTCYNGRGTRYDYYASYCASCAGLLIDTFDLKVDTSRAA